MLINWVCYATTTQLGPHHNVFLEKLKKEKKKQNAIYDKPSVSTCLKTEKS